jgi:dTDP-4-dehydrorhamnose 3,5-epimerase
MHWQDVPHQETKLVRCLSGSIFDVVIDLRADSRTFRKYFGVNLASKDGRMLYIPKGCAHGFLTLADDSEVLYFISEYYAPREQRGLRWNDPAIGIAWPEPIRVISERDQSFPDFAG